MLQQFCTTIPGEQQAIDLTTTGSPGQLQLSRAGTAAESNIHKAAHTPMLAAARFNVVCCRWFISESFPPSRFLSTSFNYIKRSSDERPIFTVTVNLPGKWVVRCGKCGKSYRFEGFPPLSDSVLTFAVGYFAEPNIKTPLEQQYKSYREASRRTEKQVDSITKVGTVFRCRFTIGLNRGEVPRLSA